MYFISNTAMNQIGITVLFLSVHVWILNAQDSVQTTPHSVNSSISDDKKNEQRPIEKGLQPLYIMTNTFLDVIQPESKGSILNDDRFSSAMQEGDIKKIWNEVVESFHDWRFWCRHYVGYTVCAAVGVVFIVVMPLIGLIFCCCRCFGKCGGKKVVNTVRKGDGCRRMGCGILLLVVNTFITAGLVCAFVTNELIHQQTSKDDGERGGASLSRDPADISLLDTVVNNLRNLQSYQASTNQELNSSVIGAINEEIWLINIDLDTFPNRSMDRLSSITNVRNIMDKTTVLADTFEQIGISLQKVQLYSHELLECQTQLDRSLNKSKSELLDVIPTRSQCRACPQLRQGVKQLNVGVDFSQVQNVTVKLASLQSFIDREVQQKLNNGRQELVNFTGRLQVQVRGQIEDHLADVRAEVNSRAQDILKVGQDLVNDVKDAINSIELNGTIDYISDKIQPEVNKYGNYRYYIGIALSSLLVLIAVLLYLGLCFGVCGEAAGEDSGSCNRGVGASFLMTGVGVTFLFTWLLMVAVVVLFVTGGMSYAEACRPLVNDKNEGLVKVANQYIAARLNQTNIRLSLDDLLTRCKNDTGIYTALNLESVFNLTQRFDSVKTDIRAVIEGLNDRIKPDLDSVVVIDSSIISNLHRADKFVTDGINFTSFQIQLNQPVVTQDLGGLARTMKTAVNAISDLNATEKVAINNKTDELYQETQPLIDNMLVIRSNLSLALSELEHYVGPNGTFRLSDQINDLIQALNNTRDAIRMNSTDIIYQFVGEFSQEMYDDIIIFANSLQWKLKNSVGRCKPLYDVIKSTTHSACYNFLSPYNGFWFSVGWCLFFLVLSIVISVRLSDLYRRTDDYYSSTGKRYDESCYDAYGDIHHPDYFRLDETPSSKSKPRQRASTLESEGHSNGVYEPDESALAGNAEHSYPGARSNINRLQNDPGFVRPSIAGSTSTSSSDYDFYYPPK